jgi:carbon-monoxide dehydrogenase medium subunit
MYAVEPREYLAPVTLDDALSAIAGSDRVNGSTLGVLAGGQSLVPLLRSRQHKVDILVDLNRIAELGGIEPAPDAQDRSLRLGAMVRYRELADSSDVRERFTALSDAALSVGDVQVRNRGTLGGSLAFADTTADVPAAVAALRGDVILASRDRRRRMPVDDFIRSARITALEPGELIAEVLLPEPTARSGSAYTKFGITTNGRPVVGVAAAVALDDAGTCMDASVVVSGLRTGPWRATTAQARLVGGRLDPEAVARIAQAAAAEAPVHTDLRGSAEYRRALIATYLRRAVLSAAVRASGGGK